MTDAPTEAFALGEMPLGSPMKTVDEQLVRAPAEIVFRIASLVEEWPTHLRHYRYVRFRERRADGGGLVEMSAYRPFELGSTGAAVNWPTWWLSMMSVNSERPSIRFRHIGGITTGMDVEWEFHRRSAEETHVRIVHAWDGPQWPGIGLLAATLVIGPVFVHGIASRTLAGLARVAEQKGGR